MTKAYRGEEILFAVTIPDEESGETLVRPFNQTGGSKNISADAIDLDTKDLTGSDYGKVSQEISLEGIITEGDPFPDYVENAVRNKQFVEIYEINTRTKEAEKGSYMISNFERSFGNSEFATYSLSGTLNGSVTKETLTTIPDGAQNNDIATGTN
ncbi:phage major tail protein, TP901-1 family [Robertmurraya sp. DFI.2.37]|uniref:phage major tail protein, TP901-1 family n=1 Tax=Robertmurraya sp. DFI.2.37 TaxID=3031819 RepID=UPI0012480E85|nr:phage major tail protein, TP901-1 family [Robertmurraya sp. DFI.2.37]MDF1510768.1 phage major tail protein, TP901-1 family [Robertmurraya sp. DFI.2.37]